MILKRGKLNIAKHRGPFITLRLINFNLLVYRSRLFLISLLHLLVRRDKLFLTFWVVISACSLSGPHVHLHSSHFFISKRRSNFTSLASLSSQLVYIAPIYSPWIKDATSNGWLNSYLAVGRVHLHSSYILFCGVFSIYLQS